MTNKLELYKCNVCHNLVEVLNSGIGELVCCQQAMECLIEKGLNEEGVGKEHVPVVEFSNHEGVEIRVGSKPHPMEKEHYIMFIQGISPDKKYLKTKFLEPNESPELKINCKCKDGIKARDYCNIHGLWSKEKEFND